MTVLPRRQSRSSAGLTLPIIALVTLLVLPTSASSAQESAAAIDPAALAALEWRPIGPAVMGGRITDIAAVDADVFYASAATGNLWKTTNRGTTWEPLFEDEEVNSIGDVTLAPSNPNIVWVGTGEANNRQSSPWGAGVYKSTDGGRTWELKGLAESRHVGRIVIHPRNPDVVFVAAGGSLWGPSEERGVFRSMDGGDTWEKVLFIDEDTGATDIAMDPGDPDTLIAAMYQRRRTACCFIGGGPGSGMYRTTDGGDTWVELTEGLPEGDKGRISIDFYRRDGNLVYATVEAARPGSGVYRSEDRGTTWEQMSETNPRPMYFSQIRVDPNDPKRIYVPGVRLHVSDDEGRTWNNNGADRVHSDFHALWIDPDDSDHVLLGGDGGVAISFDRSRTWRFVDNLPIGQFYEIGVDMQQPYFVYGGLQDNGSWGGPSATLTNLGIRNADWFNVNGGDGFYTRVDPSDPSIMFAESQNGNLVRVDLDAMERQSIRPIPRPDRRRVTDFDVDSNDGPPNPTRQEGDEAEEDEVEPYRFNWNSPVIISEHDTATIYYGGNKLMRSRDRGYTWEEVSPDLTRSIDRDAEDLMGMAPTVGVLSRNDGISSYGNITTVTESPLDASVIYVGTDDGNVQRTRDGGMAWTDLTETFPGLPDRTYVSRLHASAAVEGRVYATFDNHYHSDFKPYVYVSDDYGDSWRSITGDLPEWSVNAILEHPRTPDLLFLGNEQGVYMSVDRGDSWIWLKNNLPTVPVDDIVIHPRDNDLVIGTHGRSIWIMTDITPLEQLTAAMQSDSPTVFPVRPVVSYSINSPQGWTASAEFRAPNPEAGALIRYWVPEAAASDDPDATLQITLTGADGEVVRALEGPSSPGLHEVRWDLRTEPPYEPDPDEEQPQGPRRFFGGPPPGLKVLPGTYSASIADAGSTSVAISLDPRVDVTEAELRERQDAMEKAYELARPFYEANRAVQRLSARMADVEELLDQATEVPEPITEAAGEIQGELRALREEMQQRRRGAASAFALERSTSRPTDDQLWSLREASAEMAPLIERINVLIADRLPTLYDQLNAAGIRPDLGEPLQLPVRGQQ